MFTTTPSPMRLQEPLKVTMSCKCDSIDTLILDPWVTEKKCLVCGYTIFIELADSKEASDGSIREN